jgi:hypothetical protein
MRERLGAVLSVHHDPEDAASAGLLPGDLVVAEPDVAGPLALFPLFAGPGAFEYVSFAEAASRGFVLQELEWAAVNDLRAVNPLDVAVLISDAEVVEGAQQDRVADVPVLVGAGTRRRHIPVSCVEPGRWEEARHGEPFAAAAHAVPPSLRAQKSRRVREALAQGLEPRADQDEIWESIDECLEEAEIAGGTDALRDVYAQHGDRLAELEAAMSRRDGQTGALVCLHGRPVVLDYVSRPDAWAALWRPLVRGYCLDALAYGDGAPYVDVATAEAFLATADAMAPVPHDAVGLGRLVTLEGDRAGGLGLMLDRELVHASVFAA